MQPVYNEPPAASPANNTDECIREIVELVGAVNVIVLTLFPCIGATERNKDDSSLQKVIFHNNIIRSITYNDAST